MVKGVLSRLSLAALGIGTAGSQNVQVKTWKSGDVLTAEDLNMSFMAAQNAASPPDAGVSKPVDYAWSAFLGPSRLKPATDGHVARFTFNSPVDGFVQATALYSVRVRNTFDSTPADCSYETLLAATPGFQGCPPLPGGACDLPG